MSKRRPNARAWLLASVVATTGFTITVAAQQGAGYGSWQPAQDAAGDTVRTLVDELRSMVDEAERARAADPRFIRDLRDLVSRHDRPWRVSLLKDDFRDGDFTRNPAWTVVSGSFRADANYGLITESSAPPAAPAARSGSGDGKDLAAALITGLLSQYAQPAQQQGAPTTQGPARIETRVNVSNAFAFEASVATDTPGARIEFSLFQGDRTGPAYRLVYLPGSRPSLQLLRGTARGDAIIDTHEQVVAGADGALHRIVWTRSPSGEMTVSVDGTALINIADRGLRDPFSGISITNHGGRFAVREVSLWGMP